MLSCAAHLKFCVAAIVSSSHLLLLALSLRAGKQLKH
jgi:hypothetical protein